MFSKICKKKLFSKNFAKNYLTGAFDMFIHKEAIAIVNTISIDTFKRLKKQQIDQSETSNLKPLFSDWFKISFL